MDLFEKWGMRETGLLTFAHSPTHIGLYQKLGYWPRFLTAIMSKAVTVGAASRVKYSALDERSHGQVVTACRELTDSIDEGLELTSEIRSLNDPKLGDRLLLWDSDLLEAFAVCHCDNGSEADEETCYIKFVAARPSSRAANSFELLDACEALAGERGLKRIEAGVNLNRSDAYRQMLRRGFRIDIQGVAMHKAQRPCL